MAYKVLGTEPAKLHLGILCYDCLHDLKCFNLFCFCIEGIFKSCFEKESQLA